MRVQLDVRSDYVCPFCYLEEPVLTRMREEFREQLTVRWRAFELRPEPVPTLPPGGDYLVNIWERAVYPMARERRMNLKLPPVQPRSRLALEAAECARAQGKFDAMHAAIFRAFFEEGREIGEMATLLELGENCGLERAALQEALTSGQFRSRVLADEEMAFELSITGVPAMLLRQDAEPFEAARSLSGAQPEPCFAGQMMAPGSFTARSAGLQHFAWSSEETVVPVHGEGPFQIDYVNSADDPRNAKK